MEPSEEEQVVVKQRHGCVTIWLLLLIVVNSLIAFRNLFLTELIVHEQPVEVSADMIIFLGIIGLANIMFAAMLFRWEKSGFWGFLVTSAVALFVEYSIGLGIGQSSLLGLLGIAVLYVVLQLKKDQKPTWDGLN